jgi:large subunit ribosomal protein L22
MSAEDEKDDVTPADAPEAKKPAAKKAAVKKPAKAAAKADAKAVEAKAGDGKAADKKAADGKAADGKASDGKASESKAAEGKKPAAKKAAKKPAATKEPLASEKKEPAKAAAKAPRRRIVRAHARYVRTSARKARMVCGHLRGKSVQEARAILAFTPREVARDWSKLLESAVANAESNHELLEDELIVREAYADEGPTIKRFRPRAMGRATPIRKRTSHLTIALTTDTTQRTTKRNG